MDVVHPSPSGLAAIPSWWLIVGLLLLMVTGLAPRAVAGSINALLRGVAFLFSLPAAVLAQLSAACRSLLDRSLAWEEERLGLPQRTFAALMVCTRLLLGLVSGVVIVATGYQDMESLTPILLGPDAPPVALPVQLNLGFIQGSLTFAILSLMGMLVLEVLNPAHANLALFPNPKPAFKRVLVVIAAAGSCLSLVMVTLIFVDRELMAQGYTWPLAGILISACLGILSNVCSMIAFWAAVLGLMALFSTLMALLYLLVRLLAVPFELLRDLFSWIVQAQLVEHLVNLLGAPVRGLANVFLGSALGRGLRLHPIAGVFDVALHRSGPSAAEPIALDGSDAAGVLTAADVGFDAERAGFFGRDRSKWENLRNVGRGGGESGERLNDLDGVPKKPVPAQTSFVSVGDAGMQVLQATAARFGDTGAQGSVRLATIVPLDTVPDGTLMRELKKGSVTTRGITPKQYATAHIKFPDPQTRKIALLNAGADALLQHTPLQAGKEPVVLPIAVADVPLATSAVATIKRARPEVVLLPQIVLDARALAGATAASGPRAPRPTDVAIGRTAGIQAGYAELQRWYAEHLMTAAFLIDPGQGLLQHTPTDRAWKLIGHEIAGLLCAQRHDAHNPTAVTIGETLGAHAPFIGLAVGSSSLLAGPPLRAMDPGRLVRQGGGRGRGDVNQICATVEGLIPSVYADPAASTCGLAPAHCQDELLGAPVFVQVSVPLQRRDPRLSVVRARLETFLASQVPGAQLSLLCANGQADATSLGAHQFAEVGIFFAVAARDVEERSAPPEPSEQHASHPLPSVLPLAPVMTSGHAASMGASSGKKPRRTVARRPRATLHIV